MCAVCPRTLVPVATGKCAGTSTRRSTAVTGSGMEAAMKAMKTTS